MRVAQRLTFRISGNIGGRYVHSTPNRGPAPNNAFIEVVNTGSDYTNWSAWLVIDTSGSTTDVGVNIAASFESAKN